MNVTLLRINISLFLNFEKSKSAAPAALPGEAGVRAPRHVPRDRLVAHAREVVLLPRVERHRGRAVTRGRGRCLEDDWRPELRVPDISKCMNNVNPPL